MLIQDPPPVPQPTAPVICSHTKKVCDQATLTQAQISAIQQVIAQLRAAVNRSVILGAMIGAGIGSAAKDLLQWWLG